MLWQRFDGKFWNGREWVARVTELPLKLEGINWIYAGALPKTGSNAATDLIDGRYDLRVRATDNGGNVTNATNRITVQSAPVFSAVRLSTAAASTASVTLRFTGALDATIASDLAHYAVLQDGPPLKFTAATYAENTVTLSGLNLSAGQNIALCLEGLRDASGKMLQNGTIQLTVR